ncbi:MAG TPA: hypothetical protein VKY22_00535 [Bradyrhizobium sp.]|jgi:hypothetical protein|nr:hypothetical protein [Bradyrhizobium sp.]
MPSESLELLFVVIPELPPESGFIHHPISRSGNPRFYRPAELTDTGEARTEWLQFFEEIFVGLFWKLGRPVPFAFRTANGHVRSLDAGCLRWLANRKPPAVNFILEQGLIKAAAPSPALLARYESQKAELVDRVTAHVKQP